MVIVLAGENFINPVNHTPYIPAPSTFTTPEGVTHAYRGVMASSAPQAWCSSRSSASTPCRLPRR